jgi:hypothetical protein
MIESDKDVCEILSRHINRLNPELKINKYINEELNSCTLDISDKEISENASKSGLGKFESFMSIAYNKRRGEINFELPIILAIDKRKKDDTIVIPNNCIVGTIHSHSGKQPVIHLHIDCKSTDKLLQLSELINNITKINRKNS